jgi:hypothetical protein
MKKIFYYLMISVAFITSCSKDGNEPDYEGEIILSSEKVKMGEIYNTVGFSFEKGKNVPYPITTDVIPDLVMTHLIDLDDNVIVTFTSPKNQEAFYLNQTFSSADEAKTWFDNYAEAPESVYLPLADSVQINQVWTIRTIDKKYAKLLIKKIVLMTDNPVADYVNVTVDYQYQPDGSRLFDGK